MTKEEVREVSICKLNLTQNAVVYDIGSGTGSVAIEIAGVPGGVQVYAIERKPEAVELLRKNREHFHMDNIQIIEATAPEGLEELPGADPCLYRRQRRQIAGYFTDPVPEESSYAYCDQCHQHGDHCRT